MLDFGADVFVHVLDGLAQSQPVARYDGCGVYAVLHEFIGAAEELGGDDDDGGGTVADLRLLTED